MAGRVLFKRCIYEWLVRLMPFLGKCAGAQILPELGAAGCKRVFAPEPAR